MKQELKGIAFLLIREFVEQAFGPQGLERVFQRVSPETRKIFESTKKHRFYPWGAYVEFEQAVVDEFFGGDPKAARKIGGFVAQLAMKREYRLVFTRFRSPKDAVMKVQKLWNLYLRPGYLEVKEMNSNYWTITLKDFPINELYAEHLSGWLEKVLNSFKTKRARVSWERSGPDWVFHVMWEG